MLVPCLSSFLRFCTSVMEKFLGPRGQVYEMYRASVCTVKFFLYVMRREQGVLIHGMVTYESNFIVDYDGGGDKIKQIKRLKNTANNKMAAAAAQQLTACCKISVFIIAQRIETVEKEEV